MWRASWPRILARVSATCHLPQNPGAGWWHVPYFSFRSYLFEAVICNDALADLFMYSNTLDHPVVVSKFITANSCVRGQPHIYYLYRARVYFLWASGYHYQAEWYPRLKAPLVFILPPL